MTVRERIELPAAGTVPDAVGRAAYRVVQEGLTNARKHAPGTAVDVRLGLDGGELVVEVVSPRPVGASPALAGAGSGVGLIGLGERLAVVGGRLEHGPDERGDFHLRATLPAVG
jgi:signal transduction histidine kinase